MFPTQNFELLVINALSIFFGIFTLPPGTWQFAWKYLQL